MLKPNWYWYPSKVARELGLTFAENLPDFVGLNIQLIFGSLIICLESRPPKQ